MSVPSTGFTHRFNQYENLYITLLKILHATVRNWPVGGRIFEKLNSLSFPGHLKFFPQHYSPKEIKFDGMHFCWRSCPIFSFFLSFLGFFYKIPNFPEFSLRVYFSVHDYGLDEFRVMSVPSTGFTHRFHQYENLHITLLKILYATVQNWPVGGYIFEKLNSLSFPGHLKFFPKHYSRKEIKFNGMHFCWQSCPIFFHFSRVF